VFEGQATQAWFNIGIRCASDASGNIFVAGQGFSAGGRAA
jgi:hypothetical protein